MKNEDIKTISNDISRKLKVAGIKQEQISKALSVSQSQISRLLSGKSKRRTKLFDNLCIYANSQVRGVSADLVRENEDLLQAIASIWDGSASQAQSIVRVIKSLEPFCKATASSKSVLIK
jgi:transcriptional regulator with XRE-family HTH domain